MSLEDDYQKESHRLYKLGVRRELAERDAEIERQRAINFKLALLVQSVPGLKQLITDMADALSDVEKSNTLGSWMLADVWRKCPKLLQRAKEAIK